MLRRIALAVGVLVAVATVLVVLQGRQAREQRAERREGRLLQFDDRRVDAFTVTENGAAWRFERHGGGWRLTAPIDDAASTDAIEKLFSAARRAPVTRAIESPEALSSYGLDPARVVLALHGVDAPPLSVGDPDPTGEGVFARVEGRPGVLVLHMPEASALRYLSAERLRDPSPVGVVRADVRSIALATGADEVRLEKSASGWWITAPRRLPASDAAVEAVLGALDKLSIRALDDAADRRDPALGLGGAARRIAMTTHDGTRTLTLGATRADGSRAATRDDRETLMLLDAASLDGVPWGLGRLADTRLTKLNRFAVTRLAFASGAARVEGVREGESTWKAPDGSLLEAGSVLAFLVRAFDAPVAAWDAPAPTLPPAATLDVDLEGQGHDRIEFWADGRARLASLPGAVAKLSGPIPEF